MPTEEGAKGSFPGRNEPERDIPSNEVPKRKDWKMNPHFKNPIKGEEESDKE